MKKKPNKTPGLFDRLDSPSSLRRQKASETRLSRQRKLELLRRALFSTVFIVVIGFLGWRGNLFLRTDTRFNLQTIELRGERYLSLSEVEAVFQGDRERNLYDLPLELRRAQLEQLPWVRRAHLTRILPSRLRVSVEERVPVAFLWTEGGIGLVDAEGVVLDAPPEANFTFPVLRGVSEREPAETRSAKLNRFMEVLRALESSGPDAVRLLSEVHLGDPGNLQLVLSDGFQAIRLHLGDQQFSDRFQTYYRHISDWRQQFAAIQSIDLRYQGQAVIQTESPDPIPVETRPVSSPSTVVAAEPPAAEIDDPVILPDSPPLLAAP